VAADKLKKEKEDAELAKKKASEEKAQLEMAGK